MEWIIADKDVNPIGTVSEEEGIAIIRRGIEEYDKQTAWEKHRHGHWINGYRRQSCSVCGYRGMRSWDYCPSCGSRMDEVTE